MPEFLYGKSPLREALRAGRRSVLKVFYQAAAKDPLLQEVLTLARNAGIPAQEVGRDWFKERFPNQLTQGVAAEVREYPYAEWAALTPLLSAPTALVLALDQVQDPQNLGAILRSAECTGVGGVLVPADRSALITPAVCKAAAGAAEHLSVLKVVNLAQSLKKLKDSGFWVVGTVSPEVSTAEDMVQDALSFSWPEKTALVLGGEGEGMRRLVREHCDFLIHLPLLGKISSLNVSATAAILLYLYIKQTKK